MLGGAELVASSQRPTPLARGTSTASCSGSSCVEQTPYACVFRALNAELRVTFVSAIEPAPYTVLGWRVDDIDASARRS